MPPVWRRQRSVSVLQCCQPGGMTTTTSTWPTCSWTSSTGTGGTSSVPVSTGWAMRSTAGSRLLERPPTRQRRRPDPGGLGRLHHRLRLPPSRPTASHHDRVAARAPDRRRDRGPQRLPLRRSALRLRGLGLRGSGSRGDRAARRGLRRLDRGRARSGRGGARPPVRTGRGPWADRSMAELVLHVNREVIHHGAEIALLRDLWADGLGSSPREDAAHARHAPTRRQRTRRPRRLRRPAARRVPLRRLRSHRRARPPRAPCPWAPW